MSDQGDVANPALDQVLNEVAQDLGEPLNRAESTMTLGADVDENGNEIRKNEGLFQVLHNCWTIYERRTMLLIGLQLCNQGGSAMLTLSCTIYFLYHGISPEQTTYYICAIVMPEVFSLFWGIFAESVSIWGKRGHIVLAGDL